jgi:paired amphipathic helix protein Sin3a
MQTTNNGPGKGPILWSTTEARTTTSTAPPAPSPTRPPSAEPKQHESQTIEPAVQYVQKIKQRCDAETYRQFLDILSKYHHKPDTIDEVQNILGFAETS